MIKGLETAYIMSMHKVKEIKSVMSYRRRQSAVINEDQQKREKNK